MQDPNRKLLGFCESYIEGNWISADPTYDAEMCKKAGLKTVEFDGRTPAILHKNDLNGSLHLDYIRDRGFFQDFPCEKIKRKWRKEYKWQLRL